MRVCGVYSVDRLLVMVNNTLLEDSLRQLVGVHEFMCVADVLNVAVVILQCCLAVMR